LAGGADGKAEHGEAFIKTVFKLKEVVKFKEQ